MSQATATSSTQHVATSSAAQLRLHPLEQWVERVSDHLNPILVKETRQALKGRGFAMTFMVVLILAWLWCIMGIAMQSPGIYYLASGPYMLAGFLVVAALPLLIVVPFSAFRSMAVEREEGTFELLSITNLQPWQLVTGKLCSAALQIVIYLSVLAPCIAFTYFLRGIDIFSILLILAGSVLVSLLLSAFGLLMAANSSPRWHTASSVVLLLALIGATFWCSSVLVAQLASGLSFGFRDSTTWIGIAGTLTSWFCLMLLLVLAAAAAVTFASDNRATPLRVATLLTHSVWFAWLIWIWHSDGRTATILYGHLFPMAVFWWFCGSCISGERTLLTPRVRRSLPTSVLGRMLWMPFYPGRGLGYLFVVANILAMAVLTLLFADLSFGTGKDAVMTTVVLTAAYLIGYLGVSSLLMRAFGKRNLDGPARALTVNLMVVVMGALFPWSIHLSLPRQLGTSYSMIETSNFFWTLLMTAEGSITLWPNTTNAFPLVPPLVISFALLMLFINLALTSHELVVERSMVPERVLEDQREQTPDKEHQHVPSHPWDDPQTSTA